MCVGGVGGVGDDVLKVGDAAGDRLGDSILSAQAIFSMIPSRDIAL